MNEEAINCFPLPYPPRKQQEEAIKRVQAAFTNGYNTVILEGPVGSGKSAIAMSLALFYGTSHVLTPRKSLQNQYFHDFSEHVVVMKGRRAYPCFPIGTDKSHGLTYKTAVKDIANGNAPLFQGRSCAEGPCLNSRDFKKSCLNERECPYSVAIKTALLTKQVVHNFHSFIFQASLNGIFDVRDLLVIDECHDMEDVIRELLEKKVTVRHKLLISDRVEIPTFETADEWSEWFEQEQFLPLGTARDVYLEQTAALRDSRMKNFVLDVTEDATFHTTTFRFIPMNIGNAAEALILRFGKRRLLMSGTIYDKDYFCSRLGLKSEEVAFVRLPSTFQASHRPVYLKREYLTDNSSRVWQDPEAYAETLENVRKLLEKMPDRGLIHAPSYFVAHDLVKRLNNPRLVTHDKDNFLQKLHDFFENSEEGSVFVSPVCQQGVDFKDDRARFQLVLRLPYLNTGDVFVKAMLDRGDFRWYEYKALITFGQMLGRVVRSEEDYGTTVLLDWRFKKFLQKYRTVLPMDFFEALKT